MSFAAGTAFIWLGPSMKGSCGGAGRVAKAFNHNDLLPHEKLVLIWVSEAFAPLEDHDMAEIEIERVARFACCSVNEVESALASLDAKAIITARRWAPAARPA